MLLFLELIWTDQCILINKGKDILILGKGPTQGLNNSTLTAETLNSINPNKAAFFEGTFSC